jgi:hypothetical protein
MCTVIVMVLLYIVHVRLGSLKKSIKSLLIQSTYQEEGAAGWPVPPALPPLAAETLFEPQSLLLAALYYRTKMNDNRRK